MKLFGIRAVIAAALSTALFGALLQGKKSAEPTQEPDAPQIGYIVYAEN